MDPFNHCQKNTWCQFYFFDYGNEKTLLSLEFYYLRSSMTFFWHTKNSLAMEGDFTGMIPITQPTEG